MVQDHFGYANLDGRFLRVQVSTEPIYCSESIICQRTKGDISLCMSQKRLTTKVIFPLEIYMKIDTQ